MITQGIQKRHLSGNNPDQALLNIIDKLAFKVQDQQVQNDVKLEKQMSDMYTSINDNFNN
jgi:hypothetical protein